MLCGFTLLVEAQIGFMDGSGLEASSKKAV